MPFKTLLTFYAHRHDEVSLRTSLMLAKQYASHLDVLHVMRDAAKDTQELALSLSSTHLEALNEMEEENQLAEAGMLFKAFMDMSGDMGVTTLPGSAQQAFLKTPAPCARWMLAQAEPQDELVTQSHVHDVTIVAWHKEHREIHLETLLAESARPVMIIPEHYRPSPFSRAGILWNRSAGATHAVAMAMPLLRSLSHVHVIISPEKEATPSQGLTLAEHLRTHGINAQESEVESGGNTGERLYAACEKNGCDIIVMGAFSGTSLRKKLLGGVTQTLLEKSAIPLLMAY